MIAISLATAQAQLALYIAAEAAVLTGQSYKIGERELRRADLDDIQRGTTLWSQRVQEASSTIANGGAGRSRTMRVAS